MLRAAVASAIAFAWAGAVPAHAATDPQAQDTSKPGAATTPTTTPVPSDVGTSTSSQASDTQGGDVIVTAQRRSERLVDVPISISSVTSAELLRAGPNSLESLTKVVPGIYVNTPVYALSPTIRGIGSTQSTLKESNVSIYVDGVYHPTQAANLFDLASIADVQVLKGPQGTLFGRNASGGAILVNTLDPSFTSAGRFNVSYERFDQVRSSAYLNVPLGQMFAVNASASYRYSRGYIHDLLTGAIVDEGRTYNLRGKLLFKPADNLRFIFTAAYNSFDDPHTVYIQNVAPAPILTSPLVNPPATSPIAYGRFESSQNPGDAQRTKASEFSLRAIWDTSVGTLSSTTAQQKTNYITVTDADATYAFGPLGSRINTQAALPFTDKTFSQELNLTSRADRPLTYVTGVYYFYRLYNLPGLLVNGVSNSHQRNLNRAIAGYADGTYHIGDLALTAGIRFTSEHRVTDSGPGGDPAPYVRHQEVTENRWTPRAVVRYSLAATTNIYASYTQGYQSGTFEGTALTGNGAEPEKVNAYEVGFKTASRPFSLNAAAFLYDYTDLQANTTTVIAGPPVTFQNGLTNAGRAKIYGVDLDATLRLNSAFDLRAAFAYTHSRYTSFPRAQTYIIPSPATALSPYVVQPFDASGHPLVRAPEFTASGSINYHAEILGGNRFDASISPYYSSPVYFDFASTLRQPSYFLLDASASLTVDRALKLSVFARNLTDKVYYTYLSTNAFNTAGLFGTPRTYGVSVGYSF